ncbi:MAG: hypothetical protein J5585_06580 [Clostridia bacterium]|nr:hypothetical protein [Clostridia bacterium]
MDRRFESIIEKNAESLRGGVKYTGAASSAKERKKSVFSAFVSLSAAPLAVIAAAAALIGGGSYFLIRSSINNGPGQPAGPTDTGSGFMAPQTTAVHAGADETAGDTTGYGVTTEPDAASDPVTVSPETSGPDTEELTDFEQGTALPDTTEPDTTATQTTAPVTATDPGLDKNGYKLTVNGRDITNKVKFGTDGDGDLILPFSVILNELSHASAKITGADTATLTYEGDVFTLNAAERTMTGNNYSGDWFKNKQSQTLKLYIEDGVLYADSGTVSAFLSEFAGGGVVISGKTIAASDFYNGDDTPYNPPETTTAAETEPAPLPVKDYPQDVLDFFDLEQKHHPSFMDAIKIFTTAGSNSSVSVKAAVSVLGKPHGMIGYEINAGYYWYCWVLSDGRILRINIHNFDTMGASSFADILSNARFSAYISGMSVSTALDNKINETTRSIKNKLLPCTIYYDGSPVPDNLGPLYDFEEIIHKESLSKQSDHQTKENLALSDSAAKKFDTGETVRYYIRLTDPTENWSIYNGTGSPVSISGQKIWLYDREGNVIDYMLTNSDGVASFDLYPGTYRFVRETASMTDAHQDENEIITVRKNLSVVVRPGSGNSDVGRTRTLDLFEKGIFKRFDMSIKIIDSQTKEPLQNAMLSYSNKLDYFSDENGMIFIDAEEMFFNRKPYSAETAFVFTPGKYRPVLTCDGHQGKYLEDINDGDVIELYPPRPVINVPYTVTLTDSSTGEAITGATVRITFKGTPDSPGTSTDWFEAADNGDGTYSVTLISPYIEDFNMIRVYAYYSYAFPGHWDNGAERTNYCRIMYDRAFDIDPEKMKRPTTYVFSADLAGIREEKADVAISEAEFTLVSVTHAE